MSTVLLSSTLFFSPIRIEIKCQIRILTDYNNYCFCVQVSNVEIYNRCKVLGPLYSCQLRRQTIGFNKLTIQLHPRCEQTEQLKRRRFINIGLPNDLLLRRFAPKMSSLVLSRWEPVEVDRLLGTPHPEDSPLNINNALNDDCLYEVFKKCNDLYSLMSLSRVCERFQMIAQRVFAARLRRANEKIIDHLYNKPLCYIEEFLESFGALIGTVDLTRRRFRCASMDTIYSIMSTHCINMHTLQCRIDDQRTIETAQLLPTVKRLHIIFTDDNDGRKNLERFFPHDSQLKSLTLEFDRYYGSAIVRLPEQKLPKLTVLKLVRAELELSSIGFNFFTRNRGVVDLMLDDVNVYFGFIIPKMASLQRLTLRTRHTQYRHESWNFLQRMRRLDTLELHLENDTASILPMVEMIAVHEIPLTRLLIREANEYVPKLIPTICKIKTLKYFNMVQIHTIEDVTSFKQCASLQEFSIYAERNFTSAVFELLQCGGKYITKIHVKYGISNKIEPFVDRVLWKQIDHALREKPMDFKIVLLLKGGQADYSVRQFFSHMVVNAVFYYHSFRRLCIVSVL